MYKKEIESVLAHAELEEEKIEEIAEAVELLKKEHGESGGIWRAYDVSIDEIIPSEPKIILESFCAG